MSKNDFIYLKIWCDSVTFVRGDIFFDSPCMMLNFDTMTNLDAVFGILFKYFTGLLI